MLLLIALANAPSWLPAAQAATAEIADTAWVFTRSLLVDGRSYPLFSILFGFGLATIAARYDEPREAGRMLRRRGWWLIAFGAVHALLYPGDVLGAYGLTAVVLSALIARRRRNALISFAVVIAVLASVTLYAATSTIDPTAPSKATGPDILTMTLWERMGLWAISSIGAVFITAVLPCVVIGVFIQHSGVLTEPWRHRRLLAATAAVGLGAAAALGIPSARVTADDTLPLGGDILHGLGSYPGGLGWLALIALLAAGRSREVALGGAGSQGASDVTEAGGREHGRVVGMFAAIGQRSLTAYLTQTILFAPVFYGLEAAGARDAITPVTGAAIAIAVWILAGLLCVLLDRAGRPGPFEALNRRLVYGRRRREVA